MELLVVLKCCAETSFGFNLKEFIIAFEVKAIVLWTKWLRLSDPMANRLTTYNFLCSNQSHYNFDFMVMVKLGKVHVEVAKWLT